MSEQGSEPSERDSRALVVALLLGEGWTGAQVSAALKVTDAGGSVADAFAAMRAVEPQPVALPKRQRRTA